MTLCECGCQEQVTPGRRYVHGHNRRHTMSLADRLAKSAEPTPGGCLLWTGSTTSFGYGEVMYRGKKYAAHRASYSIAFGVIADGLEVCHRCDNPRCIEPSHLFLGSHKENMSDMFAKGRGPIGERAGNAIITEAVARDIRARREAGESYRSIARALNVSKDLVRAVAVGRTWRRA